jgi:hypothetical protein
MRNPVPARSFAAVLFAIPALLSVEGGRTGEMRPQPPPFTYLISVVLKGSPNGISERELAGAVVMALKKQTTEFAFLQAPAIEDPCKGAVACDHVTVEVSIRTSDEPTAQFLVLIDAGAKGHGQVQLPKTPVNCGVRLDRPSGWRKCPGNGYAYRVFLYLKSHMEDHPQVLTE